MARREMHRTALAEALGRGDLATAVAISKDIANETRDGQLPLRDALKFLPVVIARRPADYDAWACRWLKRWLETSGATIDKAADVAAALAELSTEPAAIRALEEACR
jgi:hypothetical protein